MRFKLIRMRWFRDILILCILLSIVACALRQHSKGIESSAQVEEPASSSSVEALCKRGRRAVTMGDFKSAAKLFSKAATQFAENNDPHSQCDALLRAAHACLSLGYLDQAENYLKAAEEAAHKLDEPKLLARTHALWGNFFHISKKTRAAEESMHKALAYAEKNVDKGLQSALHNDLGNLYGSMKQYSAALAAYRTSAGLGEKHGDRLQTAIAWSNAARVCLAMGTQVATGLSQELSSLSSPDDFFHRPPTLNVHKRVNGKGEASRLRTTILLSETPPQEKSQNTRTADELFSQTATALEKAAADLPEIPDSQDKLTLLLNLGLVHMDLAEKQPMSAQKLLAGAEHYFSQGIVAAKRFQNERLASYACGYLGHLRQQAKELDTAAQLTEEAIYWARKADAPESLYQWQWQSARILSQQKRMTAAIGAYEKALVALAAFRGEISNCYGLPRGDLGATTRKLYLDYVDELLKEAARSSPDRRVALLKTARQIIEKRKVSELQDYFKDDCLGSQKMDFANVDEVIESAVVIYPIILPERLEIIATFPAGSGSSGKGGASEGREAVMKHYVTSVDETTLGETIDRYRHHLIHPQPAFDSAPARKLYDWLIGPLEEDLDRARPETLIFVPDGALRNIPMEALYDGNAFLIQSYAVTVTPGLLLARPTPLRPEDMRTLAVGISQPSHQLPALPGVAKELASISSLYDARILMDSEFSRRGFERALQKDDYNVVHIASHGKFSDTVEESFILTADGRLTLNELVNLVGRYRFRDHPLELLTLSACETAAGNDQAALGMAGIAVKTGAQSALATLWAVDDTAAQRLMTEFYGQLRMPGVSRAMALKRAKEKLLADSKYRRPEYWSPFILINNWL